MAVDEKFSESYVSRAKSAAGLANKITANYFVWLDVICVSTEPRMTHSVISKEWDYSFKYRWSREIHNNKTAEMCVLVGLGDYSLPPGSSIFIQIM